jgi:hypothetical protein
MGSTETFKADFGNSWIMLGALSIPLFLDTLILAKFGWAKFVADGMLTAAAISIALPGVWAIWLSRFRLTLGSDAVSYRSGFGRPWSASRGDIVSVTQSRAAPISKLPLGALIVLADGSEKLVNLKVFPLAAGQRLLATYNGQAANEA